MVVALTLAVGILIGTVMSRGVRAARGSAAAPDATPLAVPSPAELSTSFAKIVDLVEPAVVNINTESTVKVTRRFRAPDNSPFGEFFDRFFQFDPFENLPGDIPRRSLGSGVILDKNGYILTNFHVIMQGEGDKPVDRIHVYLHGDSNTRYRAKLVGSDKETDLAVIKIDAEKPLPTAQLGDSDSVRVGDWVLAIGSPFGLESTVTAGIVSAKGRDIEGQFKRFIQTDAAINPGNSGGPLVNMAGQVIGISTAIATRRGTYDGVGFAIPSNTARKVYNAIITTGHVSRGAIGVQFRNDNSPVKLRMFGADHGILIEKVEPGSPAERAGLKLGDVILAVDGKPIRTGDDLVNIVSESPIGNKLKLEYLRNGKRAVTEVQVGDRSRIIASERSFDEDEGDEESGEQGGILGVAVRNLTRAQAQELASQLRLDDEQGVLVTAVKPGGFGADLGVRRGDVILEVNREPVASVEDFNRLEARLVSGSDVVLLIARRVGRTFTTLYLAERIP